jgi:N-acetylmuramoyl-L-alanine amidase
VNYFVVIFCNATFHSRRTGRTGPQHACVFGAAHACISAILFAVLRPVFRSAIFLFAVCSFVSIARAMPWPQSNQTPPTPQSGAGGSETAPVQQTTPQQNLNPPAATLSPAGHLGPVIVINPAHGGTDNGAQGLSGIVEKDIVLRLARQIRLEFERQGFRVVMTRNDDSNPSYEDRAAAANAYRDAILISVHVSSTGKVGTARVYSYQFSNPVAAPGDASISDRPKSLVSWEEAQRPYLETSRRLANLLQAELAQRFAGSAIASTPFAIRELRSVSAPAIAVELSNISVADPNMLPAMGAPLASALVRSVQTLRPGNTVSRNRDAAKPQAAGAN